MFICSLCTCETQSEMSKTEQAVLLLEINVLEISIKKYFLSVSDGNWHSTEWSGSSWLCRAGKRYFCLYCKYLLGVTFSGLNKHYFQNPSTSFNQVGVKAVYPEFLSMLNILTYYNPIGLVTENPWFTIIEVHGM